MPALRPPILIGRTGEPKTEALQDLCGFLRPKRTLTFNIDITDDGETHGPPFRERRTFRNWRRIGTITFDQAVVSYNGDFVIHFRHPTWRDDQNDPATATRVNGRKVR